eukprot:CAMPEP_0174950586 /NCGR_PEP_ID=MMETSP1355-20121228/94386_1 /TAXON_ID=464990 /ORGANISM="Hemiselmis tepida, Strain CCMP443" /LENGTH=107 /DNA_ID=CAMNT_0016198201 /DNA_START=205 /DNA_END=528 /DNA_ORIENTATION=+
MFPTTESRDAHDPAQEMVKVASDTAPTKSAWVMSAPPEADLWRHLASPPPMPPNPVLHVQLSMWKLPATESEFLGQSVQTTSLTAATTSEYLPAAQLLQVALPDTGL